MIKKLTAILGISISTALLLSSCKNEDVVGKGIFANDTHSHAKPNEAYVKHMDLDLKVNFEQKVIEGSVSMRIETRNAEFLWLDVKDLDILAVKVGKNERQVSYNLTPYDSILGQGMSIPITESDKQVRIEYRTRPNASAALLWMEKEQTNSKKFPFLFTQGQAILSRTWIPCQDSPGIRSTYKAKISVPKGMLALMSASNPTEVSEDGIYYFTMLKPVPAYLIALAAGEIAFKPISNRVGVYAEPYILEAAHYEFEDTENMVQAAERLYGTYSWGRYDLLVLPASFPFGGMENPMLNFITPTILAGDRSLTSLIAHELAHSWSGNTVTNATWNDFWLNEGFTVYFERRIMEELYGRDYSEMLAELGFQDLIQTIQKLSEVPFDTRLKLSLEGRDPDEGLTDIAYEKGYFFLRMIENAVGRETFDQFISNYFDDFTYQSITTEDFLVYLKSSLPQLSFDKNKVNEWLYGTGLPINSPVVSSVRFRAVEKGVNTFLKTGELPQKQETENWSGHEWLHFVRQLPNDIGASKLEVLDEAFGFTKTGNNEVLAEWLLLSIENDYPKVNERLEKFLVTVGRRKFLTPLYRALLDAGRQPEAVLIYQKARPGYHAVTTQTMDRLLGYQK